MKNSFWENTRTNIINAEDQTWSEHNHVFPDGKSKTEFQNKNTFEYLNETKFPHFIGSWKIENDTLCNEIIAFLKKIKIYKIKVLLRLART